MMESIRPQVNQMWAVDEVVRKAREDMWLLAVTEFRDRGSNWNHNEGLRNIQAATSDAVTLMVREVVREEVGDGTS